MQDSWQEPKDEVSDEEPRNIAELIEEYESEETEVNKQKLIEKWELAIESAEFYGKGREDRLIEYIKGFLSDLYQLDEPEVLSSDWIKDNQLMWTSTHGSEYYVPSNKLYGKIVPKKEVAEEHGISKSEWAEVIDRYKWHLEQEGYAVIEKPAVPQFVADWIEEVKPDNSLRVAFEYIAQQKTLNHDDELAFWIEEGNSETFARAWLDGYKVEEEQKYIVALPSEVEHDDMWPKVALSKLANGKLKVHKTSRQTDLTLQDKYLLTEKEIKDYEPKYWPFAKKMEEMEDD